MAQRPAHNVFDCNHACSFHGGRSDPGIWEPPSLPVASDASAFPSVGDVVTPHTREYHQQLLEVWHTGNVGFMRHRFRACGFSGAGNCCCGRDDRAALHMDPAGGAL